MTVLICKTWIAANYVALNLSRISPSLNAQVVRLTDKKFAVTTENHIQTANAVKAMALAVHQFGECTN